MSHSKDPTFRNYNKSQATLYAESRRSYPDQLYDAIIRHHTETGGRFDSLLDVGCGHGNATRDLARLFDTVVGVDPSPQMINTARELGGDTSSGKPIRFAVEAAEKCSSVEGVEGGVDLLISAMAAHWFSMPEFWVEAAKAVRPEGTVALWTCASLYCHPSTPNATAVQNALYRLEREILKPFELPGNKLSADLYDDLLLPWLLSSPVPSFRKADFIRLEWGRDGILSEEDDFLIGKDTTLHELEKSLGTASMVTRWREANLDLVNTEDDCVKCTMREIWKALGEEVDLRAQSAIERMGNLVSEENFENASFIFFVKDNIVCVQTHEPLGGHDIILFELRDKIKGEVRWHRDRGYDAISMLDTKPYWFRFQLFHIRVPMGTPAATLTYESLQDLQVHHSFKGSLESELYSLTLDSGAVIEGEFLESTATKTEDVVGDGIWNPPDDVGGPVDDG
ncbi:hypothetical protein ABOM_008361 [Aspergillus bombycis]|uniref:Methyltransferase type 11 domain-containing protein n=1 Tax=Aspergillus bombycis TaxID=109264 RepID=A0A1F7ZSG3_9EURO|nr:hypothetical protein ABOM_008361 [Aspergillus bombycis]OGM42410.1 hypothetical protein ABOM_008361 [Aspergillus bombycis]